MNLTINEKTKDVEFTEDVEVALVILKKLFGDNKIFFNITLPNEGEVRDIIISCGLVGTEKEIRKVSEEKEIQEKLVDKYKIEEIVSTFLKDFGIPAHIKGHDYLNYILCLFLENGKENSSEMKNAITKVLYPTVAKKFKTTPSRVERAIRHAIEVGWSRGDMNIINAVFSYVVSSGKGKTTNSEFIAGVEEYLRLNNREFVR